MRAPNSQFAASPISSDSPRSAQRPVMPSPILMRSSSSGSATVSTTNSPRNATGIELVAVDDEHATVVVVDERAELDGDLVADLRGRRSAG